MTAKRKYRTDGLCPRCGVLEKAYPRRYCLPCHARWMREHRPAYRELPAEIKRKANCRSHANTYLARGMIERKPCAVCGDPEAQMHHHDYSCPLDVEWLCRPHHLERHQHR